MTGETTTEHQMVMEVDDETGERFPVCVACVDDWPCVYAQRDTAVRALTEARGTIERLREAGNEALEYLSRMECFCYPSHDLDEEPSCRRCKAMKPLEDATLRAAPAPDGAGTESTT